MLRFLVPIVRRSSRPNRLRVVSATVLVHLLTTRRGLNLEIRDEATITLWALGVSAVGARNLWGIEINVKKNSVYRPQLKQLRAVRGGGSTRAIARSSKNEVTSSRSERAFSASMLEAVRDLLSG